MTTIASLSLLSVSETAAELGISEKTVRLHLQAGIIPGKRLGRRWYVNASRLADFFNQSPEADGGTTSSPGPSAASRPYASETPGLPTESRGSTSSASTVIEAVHTSIGRSKTRPDSGASAAAVESGREVASGGGTDEPS